MLTIPSALRVAERIAQSLRDSCRDIAAVTVTGELLRRCPVIRTLDLLIIASRLPAVQQWVAALRLHPDMRDDPQMTSVHIVGDYFIPCLSVMWQTDSERIPVSLYSTDEAHANLASVILSGDAMHREVMQTLLANAAASSVLAPATEADIYAAVSLPFIDPALREGFSMTKDSAQLLAAEDILGDLHMHTSYSDGKDTPAAMVSAACEHGYQYLALTDHSPHLRIAHGVSVRRLQQKRTEILALRQRHPALLILHGAEVDILSTGELDYADDILESLDLVIASIHTGMKQPAKRITDRIMQAITSGRVHILAHPSGRLIGRREPYPLDYPRVFAAAAAHRVALELNASPSRLDLPPEWLRDAIDAGCLFAIGSDAHSAAELTRVREYGVTTARKGWLTPERVINTWHPETLLAWLAR